MSLGASSSPILARRPTQLRIVARSQLQMIAALGWPEWVAFVVLFTAACALIAVQIRGSTVHTYADRQLGMHFLTLLFAASWPLVVWRDQSPRQRADFETLPVSREAAIGSRVGVGLLLLLAAVATANGVAFLLGAAFGRAAEFPAVSGFAWLASALGATIVYLLGSAIAVASDTPGRWMLVLLALVYAPPLMVTLPVKLYFGFRPGPRWIYHGVFGFERAIRLAVTQAQLDTRLTEFTLGQWLPAALLWLAIGVALTAIASRRRIDL